MHQQNSVNTIYTQIYQIQRKAAGEVASGEKKKEEKKKKGGGGEGKGLGSVRYKTFVTIQVNEKPSGGEKPPTGQPNADMSMLS